MSGISRPSSARPAFQSWKLRLELVEVVAALGKPHRLGRLGADPVLVPGDLPGDRDDHLAADARERHDRDLRLAEALRDPGDRPPIGARVEEVGGLDEVELLLGETPQDRLGRNGWRLGRALAAEEAGPRQLRAGEGLWGRSASSGFPPAPSRARGPRPGTADRRRRSRRRSGEKRTVCSPMSSVRSQIAHVRVAADRVTRMAPTVAKSRSYPQGKS